MFIDVSPLPSGCVFYVFKFCALRDVAVCPEPELVEKGCVALPDLCLFDVSRGIVVRLDRAAGNSWDTRNTVIRSILEQYFTGQLIRADNAPLEFSESIGLP